MNRKPFIVGISGFSSNVGKTTLVCNLLRQLPGWEAIKVSRGHYRSCGRDPEVCCVSNLLENQPVVRSGREANYIAGKDTGRFWDSGAANVHWVIVTNDQVETGINEALSRVNAEGVIIEGNSYLEYIQTDVSVMCARAQGGTVKSSARAAIPKCDAFFLSLPQGNVEPRQLFENWRSSLPVVLDADDLPVFTHEDLPDLLALINDRRTIPA